MTRYLITGAAGMLGQDLQRALAGRDVTALTRADLDITDQDAVTRAVEGYDVVLNAAAYTAVDNAETDEDAAYAINATGTANLARAAAAAGAKFVQYSTDYVFQGNASEPYDEDAPRDPLNAYGRTKAAGEEQALEVHPDGTYVLRTAWLYGAGGPNFAKTMVKLAGSHPEITVVDDQLGQPTYTRDLAEQTVRLLDAEAPAGIYHATNSGECTWFDFAREIFRLSGNDPERVKPTDSASFVRPAARPAYSVLGHRRWAEAGVPEMRPWLEALETAAEDGVLTETW
ncbi:dTDP-4-dehydrorhamnose reductase [Gulosibacter macacae]|uniref:dTDP-4-dehydrorhamnose reductase n=1 Tax=Gulosibacter macacae TaxID=2488791 RepID=A0A3P3VZC3_9MICO|nr:dTDP-4-dehydrorhamnose reductase [Gulosibacter macacae]RRJ86789.1 dTDP-4-dehydrorhamnose reductase [Gulosibacter macacae]